MFYQVNYEKRRILIQEVIDRLTRLDAKQGAEYLKALESLHDKYNIESETDAIGVRYYSANTNLK